MFCPTCRSEFRVGIVWCANCEVDLVESIPEEDPFKDVDSMAKHLEGAVLVQLIAGDQTALREVQATLASNQVATIFGQDESPSARPGRFALLTSEEDAPRAREFLTERWQQSVNEEGLGNSDELNADECPACGAALSETAEECAECGLFVGSAV